MTTPTRRGRTTPPSCGGAPCLGGPTRPPWTGGTGWGKPTAPILGLPRLRLIASMPRRPLKPRGSIRPLRRCQLLGRITSSWRRTCLPPHPLAEVGGNNAQQLRQRCMGFQTLMPKRFTLPATRWNNLHSVI